MIDKRFSILLEELGENKNSLSKKMGLNNSTIGKIVNGDRQPSYQILHKFSETFPNVNLNWLITGEGNMMNNVYDDLKNFNKDDIISYLIMQIDDFKNNPKLDALYRILKSFNNQESLESMHEKIDELTKIVDKLKSK